MYIYGAVIETGSDYAYWRAALVDEGNLLKWGRLLVKTRSKELAYYKGVVIEKMALNRITSETASFEGNYSESFMAF